MCTYCRCRNHNLLPNENLLAKQILDTTENEPSKVCYLVLFYAICLFAHTQISESGIRITYNIIEQSPCLQAASGVQHVGHLPNASRLQPFRQSFFRGGADPACGVRSGEKILCAALRRCFSTSDTSVPLETLPVETVQSVWHSNSSSRQIRHAVSSTHLPRM